jgi:uncharacterized protein YqeY
MFARKAKDTVCATLLGTLIGAIMTKEKTFNPARQMTESEVVAEVKKMLDAVIETGQILAKSDGRDQQKSQNATERHILSGYMPQQMSEADIEAFVRMKRSEGANMGQIMSALKAEHPGQYDGKLASSIAKRVIG